MAIEKRKARVPMPVRWAIEEWAYLLEVAHSIGTTRSEFVRTAALNAARATQSLLRRGIGAPAWCCSARQKARGASFQRTSAARFFEMHSQQ